MKQLIYLSLMMIFCCGLQVMSQLDKISQNKQTSNADVALRFMTDYKKICDSRKEQVDMDKWIKNNLLLTDKFKSTYKMILADAYKTEPEVGLDFDPIFNGQDYPDKGFKITKYDSASGFVTLVGIDWKEYFVTVKIVYLNNKWLVDGAGIINIPKDKQRKP